MDSQKFQSASDAAVDSWNHCLNIMIAYHMARIYKEDIASAVKRACMAVTLKTKDRIIYEYCMRIIHSQDARSIEASVLKLQGNFEGADLT